MSTHTEPIHEHEEHAHGGAAVYMRTLILLLILTVITVGASYIQFGSANVVIALAIATVKAILVALFFMHLKYDKPMNAIIAVAGFIFLGIFLLFDFLDFGSRVNLQPSNLKPAVVSTPVPGASPAPKPGEKPEAAEHK